MRPHARVAARSAFSARALYILRVDMKDFLKYDTYAYPS